MKNFLKKNIILVVLFFLVVVLIVVKILFGKSGQENENLIPTVTPTVAPAIYEGGDTGDDSEAITKIPYTGKKMMISGYAKPGVLEVLIRNEADKQAAEVELKKWAVMWEEDFSKLKFEYKISDF